MKYLREYNLRNPEEDNGEKDYYNKPYSFSNSIFVKIRGSLKNKLNPINVHSVDGNEGFFFNDNSTLVIELPTAKILFELMKSIREDFGYPDELDLLKVGSKEVIRLWWD